MTIIYHLFFIPLNQRFLNTNFKGRRINLDKKNKKYFRFIIIIILAIIFYFVYHKYVHSKLIELANMYASDRLITVTNTIENNISAKLNEVKTIAEINFKYKNYSIDYDKILSVVKNTLTCENAFIVDTDGNYISNNNEATYIRDKEYFRSSLDGITAISNPFYSYNSQKWIISVASPIRNIKGQVEKILVVFYNISEFNDIIKTFDFGKGSISFITTTDKIIVASTSSEISDNLTKTGAVQEHNSNLSVISSMQKKASEILWGQEKFVYEDKNMLTFFRAFKNNGWILVSAIPENELYNKIYALHTVITIVTLIIILIAVIMIIHFSRLTEYLKNKKKKSDFFINSSNIITFKMNTNGGIIDYNDNFLKIACFKKSDFKNRSIYSIIPESYYTSLDSYLENILKSEATEEQLDMPVIRNDGKWIYILWNTYTHKDNKNIIDFIGTNISALKDYEKKIQKIAYFDQLTGLNNLIYLEEYFNSIIIVNTTNTKIALMYIDIDNFKYINEMFGHSAGDSFIIDISNRISSIDNIKVKLCKRSGDEFVILYEYIENETELNKYIDEVFSVINKEYYISNIRTNVSISMGVSLYPDNGLTYTELFKCADIALQRAKEEGRNRVKYFNNSMRNEIYEIISIENDLKGAIENNEFVLYYQPQYNIKTGELYGFEALIRWLSPRKGFVQPNKFIPQAEKNQLIIPIGKFAFTSTCNFIKELVSRGYDDLCISVNVSVVQIMCDDFVDFVLNTIREKNVNPKNIKLELTESVLIKSIDETVEKINILNRHGIKFSLDDFGTGYSSLSYLKQIPIDVLKIDKSFTDTISEKNTNKEILSLILNLAKCINLSVVAEGIEDEKQLNWLNSKGCDIGQGFYIGKPMPYEKAFEIIGKNMYDIINYNKAVQ